MDDTAEFRQSRDSAGGRGCFFQVDHRTWARVCELGLNPAVGYLVMARGTGRDNRTTAWSRNAIEKYTGIGRSRAKEAVNVLVREKIVRQDAGGTKPRYSLLPAHEVLGIEDKPPAPRWTWLPNAIVTGASGEPPPVELLRQTRDPMILRLLVDLYHTHNLLEDGGVHHRIIRQPFKRLKVGQRAQFTVWGFVVENDPSARPAGPVLPHLDEEHSQESLDAFWSRFQCLGRLGLIEWVRHLFEGDDPDAEMIHPYGTHDTDSLEDRIGTAAHRAGLTMVTDRQYERAKYQLGRSPSLAPVLNHIENVQLIGIARLRYRPKTKLTAAWWADNVKRGQQWVLHYEKLKTEKSVQIGSQSSEGVSKLQPSGETAKATQSDTARQMFEIWNESAGKKAGLRKARCLTKQRRNRLLARLADCGGEIDHWREACERVAASRFCRGENDRQWVADLDFLLRESSFVKVMEGNFDDPEPGPSRMHAVI